MKKILFAIAIVLTISLTASAQGRDSFFNSWDNEMGDRAGSDPTSQFALPGHFGNENTGAPLGSGLLVLTALGAGYAVYRKRNK